MEALKLRDILSAWPKVQPLIGRIANNKQHKERLQYLEKLMEARVSSNENPGALSQLIALVSESVENYEKERFSFDISDPIGNLKFLMEQHGLTQKDLSEIGTQGRVSEILSGKRPLSKKHIEIFARRFDVSPAVFFDCSKIGNVKNKNVSNKERLAA